MGSSYITHYCALVRNNDFNITIEEAWKIFQSQNQQCALSGEKLVFNSKSIATDGTASIDRIDSAIGYTKENIQWLHKDVNRMKIDLSQKDFIECCTAIANNN